MDRRWPLALAGLALGGVFGCVQAPERKIEAEKREMVAKPPRDEAVRPTSTEPMAANVDGPRPVEEFVRRALVENRTVQATFHNVKALEHRIPQVKALDDPVASNAVFPIPSVAPQYALMGYNPYNLTLAQQFPWFGTLRLRGEAAEKDVQVALAELAAAQLDAVSAVKRAYCDLFAGQRTDELLAENRRLLEDFQAIARKRLEAGGGEHAGRAQGGDPRQRARPRTSQ